MAIDYWKLVKDYSVGDTVQKYMSGRGGDLAPFAGRVTAVLKGLGFVDVQWPFGNERVSPEYLVKVNPKFISYLPPSLDFSYYPGWDTRQASRGKSLWRDKEVPPGFHRDLALLWNKGAAEVAAYDELWHRHAAYAEDEAIRDEVAKFYRFAHNSFGLLLEQHARTATYWSSSGRQHRATRAEMEARNPNCPKCGTGFRKTVYKMSEGKRSQLFACPNCMFLIKRDNIVGPGGEPVAW